MRGNRKATLKKSTVMQVWTTDHYFLLIPPDFFLVLIFASVLVTTDSMSWHMGPNQLAQVE